MNSYAQDVYNLFAEHVTREADWTRVNQAENAPDNCSDSSNYAKNFVNGSTSYLFNDLWSGFQPSSGNEIITGVYLNFNGRPNNGTNGPAIRGGFQDVNGNYNQQDYSIDQNDEFCRWISQENGGWGRDITTARPVWTQGLLHTLPVRLRKLTSGRMRINAMRLKVQTALVTQSATALDFGAVQVGATETRTITLTLSGSSSVCANWGSCPAPFGSDFSGNYCLSPSQHTASVTLSFSPTTTGTFSCEVDTGLRDPWGYPRMVTLSGTAYSIQHPSAISFGSRYIHTNTTQSVGITLSGASATICGSWDNNCPQAIETTGASSFCLSPGSPTITNNVSFHPVVPGPYSCTLQTGLLDPQGTERTIALSGIAYVPDSYLSTTELLFDPTYVHTTRLLAFQITNGGTAALAGSVASDNPNVFEVLEGGGSYSLLPGQSLNVVVGFRPYTYWNFSSTITTGEYSPSIQVTGRGLSCMEHPGRISFCSRDDDEMIIESCTIRNSGTEPISGSVGFPGPACESFFLLSGYGGIELAPGATHDIEIAFLPGNPDPLDLTRAVPCRLYLPCGQGIELRGYHEREIDYTGNVNADFGPSIPNAARVQDDLFDVTLPDAAPEGIVSGWDIEKAEFHLDRCRDELNIGITFLGVAGDADGDGLEGTTSDWLASTGGVDAPFLAGTESICMALNLNGDAYTDLIAGHDSLGNPFRVVSSSQNILNLNLPGDFFGDTAHEHTGASVFPGASSGNDYEFSISGISEFLDFDNPVNMLEFWLFAGSADDAGVGNDLLEGYVTLAGNSATIDCDPPDDIILSVSPTSGGINVEILSVGGSYTYLDLFRTETPIDFLPQVNRSSDQFVWRFSGAETLSSFFLPVSPEERTGFFYVASTECDNISTSDFQE